MRIPIEWSSLGALAFSLPACVVVWQAAFKINVAFLSEEQPGEHALLATVE